MRFLVYSLFPPDRGRWAQLGRKGRVEKMVQPGRLIVALGLLAAASLAVAQETPADPPATLDGGYRSMYNLRFEDAHKTFVEYERAHPQDPLGPVSNAAAYLFSELDRMHVLESELFTDDHKFESRAKLTPDPAIKQAFEAQLNKTQQLADQALARDDKDQDAMFATVMVFGLRGDYAALIEKRDMAAMSLLKSGRIQAEKLLAANPAYYDAYVAVGAENYLLSLRSAPLRWFLRLTGSQTDRETGLEKLRITAEKGRFLLPYARLLLAVAALRDKDRDQARSLLRGLAQEYPYNHLYVQELAKLQ